MKRRYVAVIVAFMLIMTAVLASLIVSSVQGSRIAYLSVSADKDEYAAGEEVTFTIEPRTEGVDFSIGGRGYDKGMNIIRIPDSMDPHSSIDDIIDYIGDMRNSGQWGQYGTSLSSVVLSIPLFTSSDESLSMTWNGTIPTRSDASEEYDWAQATAGYYLLYPGSLNSNSYGDGPTIIYDDEGGSYHYSSSGSSFEEDRKVKFFLDQSSVFHYGGPEVEYRLTTASQGTNIAINIAWPDDASDVTGNLSVFVPNYMSYGEGAPTSQIFSGPVDLVSDEVATVTMTVPASKYDFVLHAILVTEDGAVFTFGFWHAHVYDYEKGGSSYVLVQY